MCNVEKFFLKTVCKEKPAYIPLSMASILLNSIQPFLNLIISKSILEELTGSREIYILAKLAIFLIFGNFVIMILMHIIRSSVAVYDDWFDKYFYNLLSKKSMALDYSMAEDSKSLNQQRKAKEGIDWYSGGLKGLNDCIQKLCSCALTLMGVAVLVAVKAPILLIVAIFAVAGGSVAVWQTNKCYQMEFEMFPQINRSFEYMTKNVIRMSYAKSIRLYNAKYMMREQFENTMNKCSNIFKYTANKIGRWNCMASVVDLSKNLCIYGYLGYKLAMGNISLGDFTLLSGSANTLKESLQGIINQIQDYKRRIRFMSEYVTYIEMEESKDKGLKAVPRGKELNIEFNKVSFKYPNASDYILKDFSLIIPAGQHLSVVGLNGAGKTTLIKLLCRLYDVNSGEIKLNGVNINEYSYDEYVKELAVVFQDFKLFAMSIKDNIFLGNCSVKSEERLNSVCESAGLGDFISFLPKGLDTQIYKVFDENGIEPSGGELQKIAIARALYKDARIVILDEPTSALDPISEMEIYSCFNRLVYGKTAIFISHRLSSCRFCDKVAVVSDGKIEEYGTHEELVNKKGGLYARMFATQAKNYI